MRITWLSILCLAAACGSTSSGPARPLGVQDHLTEARQHDAEAKVHDQLAAEAAATRRNDELVCGDRVLSDQLSSGGERLLTRSPCWSAEADAVERHRADAARLRADAAQHRARARALLAAEDGACAGLREEEIDHSPFAHREDIAAVSAELDGTRLRGARIRFREVPDLDADWLRRALACHQARAAAVGNDPMHMSYCPAVVAGAELRVIDEPGGLVVVIESLDAASALVVYARAEALLDSSGGDDE